MSKRGIVYWCGAGIVALFALLIFHSAVFAQDLDADADGDGCVTRAEFDSHWNAGAKAAGVELETQYDLTDDQKKVTLIKAQNLAGSPPWDFNDISLVVSSGGVVSIVFWDDGCARGRLSVPVKTWEGARTSEARVDIESILRRLA